MKNEKYSKNMANFEAFRWNISSSINVLFLKSVCITKVCIHILCANAHRKSSTNHFFRAYVFLFQAKLSEQELHYFCKKTNSLFWTLDDETSFNKSR